MMIDGSEFLMYTNDSDVARYIDSLRDDKFYENKELSGLLKKNDFNTGSGISIQYNFTGRENKVQFPNQFYGTKLEFFSDITDKKDFDARVLTLSRADYALKILMNGEPTFIKAVVRSDNNYLYELSKTVAVDDGDVNTSEMVSAFSSKYGKPDFIHNHFYQGRLNRRTLFYAIQYSKKPCIFMAIFHNENERWLLTYNLVDLSLGKVNRSGDKLKKAF